MTKELLNCAKISRPVVSGILFRDRLFNELEKCLNCPVVWVSAPAGSGKTSLISSYIENRKSPCLWYKIDPNDSDPVTFFHYLGLAASKVSPQIKNLPVLESEDHCDISSFSHTFFTKLFSQLDQPVILVLDDYQEISEDILLHDHILEAFKWLSEGSRVIVVSRYEPSAKYSRLLVNRMMTVIQWHDLNFSTEEFFEIAVSLGYGDLPQKILYQIYEKTDGWIAGLLLILEHVKRSCIDLQKMNIDTSKEIFMYFSEEVFGYQDSDIKHFLLRTSLLPNVTSRLAQDLTVVPESERILATLNHHNLFIDKVYQSSELVYQYHPMFREFLTDCMNDFFPPGEVVEIKRHAANLLLEKNQLVEAAELLRSSGDIDGLIDLIVSHAPVLMSQGRLKFLEKWLMEIPQERISGNPWLSFWLGSCLQKSDLSKARDNFKMAFEFFCSQHDMTGAFSSWVGMVNTIIMEWHDFTKLDPLIYWLEVHYDHESGVLADETRSKVITCMAAALLIRRPDSQDLLKWVELAKNEAKHAKDVNQQIEACLVAANYYLWIGDQSNCWFLLGRIRSLSRSPKVSTLTLLKGKLLEAMMYAWYLGDASKCLQVVEDALDIGASSGIHVMDHLFFVMGTCGNMIGGDYSKATEYLQQIEERLDDNHGHCFFCYNYLAAWLSLLRDNILRACKHANEALNIAKETGHKYHKALGRFAHAQILFKKGHIQSAFDQLVCFEKVAESTNSLILKYMFLLAKAQFLFGQGKEQVGIKHLRMALKLGRQEKYRSMLLWWDPHTMTSLCIHALEENIETEYVKDLIIRRGLVPDSPPVEIDQWPWLLRVYTFGRFEIVKNGKPIRFKGKAQQKPLSLFKALITLGGRGVSALNLADVLWPDADGDMQQKSLATTLHRLRRILGQNDLIDFQDGHLSINAKFCWVDTWSFERLLSQAELESKKKDEKGTLAAIRCAEKAIDLYKGDFLPQNNMEYSCVHMREHLKSRFLRGVTLLGRNLEKTGKHDKAVLRYLHALEVDSMIEEFYQRLMIYYQRLGQNSNAVAVYKRCQKNFSNVLRVDPSPQTKAIYQSIVNEKSTTNDPAAKPKRKKYPCSA